METENPNIAPLPALQAPAPTKKGFSKRTLYSISIALFLCLVMLIWIFSTQMSSKNKTIEETQKSLTEAIDNINRLSYSYDSARRTIDYLSSYKSLTDAMSYRDEIRSPFKYRPGNMVRLKVDSSLVLITDMITGGDKYTYYFKYRIQNKDRSYEEVSPSMIY